MLVQRLAQLRRPHYAWILCVVCLLLHFCTSGMTTIGVSLHGQYLRDQLGLSNTQVSMIPTVVSLCAMVSLPLASFFYKRFSLRLGTTISCALLAVAYAGFSLSVSPWLFYFFSLFLGIARSLGTMVPITFLFRNWFGYRRSTATAVALCGSGICSTVMPPIVASMVEVLGLGRTFLAEAALMALVSVLLYVFLRDKPEELELQPYTVCQPTPETHGASPIRGVSLSHIEMALLLAVNFLAGAVAFPVGSHLSIHYTTIGYPTSISATAVSVYGGVLTCSKFFYDFLADRFGAYKINYFFLGCWTVSNFLTALLNEAFLLSLFAAAVLEGIGAASATVGVAVWVGNLSSAETYAHNIEVTQMALSIGTLATSALPGVIADATGSYSGAFLLFGCMLAAATVIIQYLYRNKRIL